jgi:hypothetical protein
MNTVSDNLRFLQQWLWSVVTIFWDVVLCSITDTDILEKCTACLVYSLILTLVAMHSSQMSVTSPRVHSITYLKTVPFRDSDSSLQIQNWWYRRFYTVIPQRNAMSFSFYLLTALLFNHRKVGDVYTACNSQDISVIPG